MSFACWKDNNTCFFYPNSLFLFITHNGLQIGYASSFHLPGPTLNAALSLFFVHIGNTFQITQTFRSIPCERRPLWFIIYSCLWLHVEEKAKKLKTCANTCSCSHPESNNTWLTASDAKIRKWRSGKFEQRISYTNKAAACCSIVQASGSQPRFPELNAGSFTIAFLVSPHSNCSNKTQVCVGRHSFTFSRQASYHKRFSQTPTQH